MATASIRCNGVDDPDHLRRAACESQETLARQSAKLSDGVQTRKLICKQGCKVRQLVARAVCFDSANCQRSVSFRDSRIFNVAQSVQAQGDGQADARLAALRAQKFGRQSNEFSRQSDRAQRRSISDRHAELAIRVLSELLDKDRGKHGVDLQAWHAKYSAACHPYEIISIIEQHQRVDVLLVARNRLQGVALLFVTKAENLDSCAFSRGLVHAVALQTVDDCCFSFVKILSCNMDNILDFAYHSCHSAACPIVQVLFVLSRKSQRAA